MTFIRLVSCILLCSIVSLAAQGQPVNARSEAAAGLRRAADLMSSSAGYWQQELIRRTRQDPSNSDTSDKMAKVAEHCDDAQQAIDLFVRFAPQAAIAQSYERIRVVYVSSERPLPASLAEAKACRDRRYGALSASELSFATTLTASLSGPFLLTAETQEVTEKAGSIHVNDALYRDVNPPADTLGLLRNLGWVADNDIVLRPDLFTAGSLHRVLGVDAFVFRQLNGSLGFDHWVRPTKVERERSPATVGKYAKCQFGGTYTPTQIGVSRGGLAFACDFPRPDSPDIEQITNTLGGDWLFLPPVTPNHGPGLPAATAAHGNERLHRETKHGRRTQRITIHLWPDATLRSFTLDEIER